ncbi:MAG: flagellar biosynthesis anti-sigma factor FlgM [bacterium]|nr:flagellar biosynthesis anti-sigma factor FlgM [bacterium]
MKINYDGVDKLNSEFILKDLNRVKSTGKGKKAENFASEDKVEISSKALDLKAMQETAMKSPDVRTEKVNAIKLQVDEGSYSISGEKIAERLIEENLLE